MNEICPVFLNKTADYIEAFSLECDSGRLYGAIGTLTSVVALCLARLDPTNRAAAFGIIFTEYSKMRDEIFEDSKDYFSFEDEHRGEA